VTEKENYKKYLQDIASISRLFSESDKPYVNSRTAEYLFCKIYEAENLSRSDIAIDAKKGNLGVGVKTFVYSGRPSLQKIAEFNKTITKHREFQGIEKAKLISKLRNERLRFVESGYGTNQLIYHCILRDKNKIIVYEESMDYIDFDNIDLVSENSSSIRFTDGKNKYSFNNSKSTLYKEFKPKDLILETNVNILDDPFDLLSKLLPEIPKEKSFVPPTRIILPLYSYLNNNPHVFPRSGLNQWNASGRPRDPNEIYIPIPVTIRERFDKFFPSREEPFELTLPDKTILTAKVSQDNGKALMSNPNSALGKWLLRDVLGLEEGELLTYRKLEELGVDSVEISKSDGKYFANFLHQGSYEDFINS